MNKTLLYLDFNNSDAQRVDQIINSLDALKIMGVSYWSQKDIRAGERTRIQIDLHRDKADYVLCFLSSNYLAELEESQYQNSINQGKKIIPILLSSCMYDFYFDKLDLLPSNIDNPVFSGKSNVESNINDLVMNIRNQLQTPKEDHAPQIINNYKKETITQIPKQNKMNSYNLYSLLESVNSLRKRATEARSKDARNMCNNLVDDICEIIKGFASLGAKYRYKGRFLTSEYLQKLLNGWTREIEVKIESDSVNNFGGHIADLLKQLENDPADKKEVKKIISSLKLTDDYMNSHKLTAIEKRLKAGEDIQNITFDLISLIS